MTEDAQPVPEAAPEETRAPNPTRMIAQVDKDFVLIGRVTNPSDADWDAAAVETKFPGGFDNALHRYRLVQWREGKWRFEPIVHPKDEAAENNAEKIPVLRPLARVAVALAKGKPPASVDLYDLETFLGTYDGQG